MLDSDSDSDDGILRPNGYVDVDVDLIDISFGGRDSGGPPPPKKTRKGKRGKASAWQSVDDTPSPFADSSGTFEDSPSFTIPDESDPNPCQDDSIVVQDEVTLDDMCRKVRRQINKETAKTTKQTAKRTTRTSRRAAVEEESVIICPEDSPEDVFDLSLNNQSSFCSDVDDCIAQPDDPNVEVSIRVFWKGSSTKKFSLRKFQKIKEIYTYYATLEGIDEGRILFTLRDKPVTPNDTPMTLNIGVSSLEGGVIDEADVSSQVAHNADSEAQEDPNALRLQVQRKGMREKHTVYVYPHEKISVLISKLSEDLKIPVSSIKLQFDGDLLPPDSTPNDHDMEGDECIDLIEK